MSTTSNVATTRLSTKGQVVIPEEIRKELGLEAGDSFAIMQRDGVVILKRIEPPSMDQFDAIVAEIRKQARKAGLKKSDIAKVIRKVRSEK